MNLRDTLLSGNSKQQVEIIAGYIGTDRGRFDRLMDLLFSGERRVVQRSSWVISTIAERSPELIGDYLPVLTELLESSTYEPVKRNITRLLQFVDLPGDLQGRIYDRCFELMYSKKEAIAVRAFSMTVCARIAMKYPELKQELLPAIEQLLPSSSAGIRSRARKTLKHLRG